MKSTMLVVLAMILLFSAVCLPGVVQAQTCCVCSNCSGITACFSGAVNDLRCDDLCHGAVCSDGNIDMARCDDIGSCDQITMISPAPTPALSVRLLSITALLLGLCGFYALRRGSPAEVNTPR